MAGISLQHVVAVTEYEDELSLLDLTILFGRSDDAAFCGAAGVKLSEKGCALLHGRT